MSPEHLQPVFDNPFHRLLQEQLGGKEIEKPTIGVLAISGTIGSGTSATSSELISLINYQLNTPTTFHSSGEAMREIQRRTTGRQTMDGHFQRTPETDREVDRELGSYMIDLNSKNSLIIAEGRLAPFVARQLQFASNDLGMKLPSEIVTIFMTADENVRYARKYLQAIKENPTIIEEEFYKGLDERSKGEVEAFHVAYPELRGINPYSINFTLKEAPVYDLFYDTATHTPIDLARLILNHDKVNSMLQKTGLKAA